ncbi:hypothetical protein CALVIDRAFT_598864 [Calocera viscosa TUFC12733]|uniref:FAR-17a/AIG1-like protein n=1 Tax=Calocera viscosa (strain TUFC12733) TaxID=1330018 RepID=A0A167LL90_CALVF|nr:hypothetical protein CALVIDRAFT_598864 [Calocera viscosa TUFC12733]
MSLKAIPALLFHTAAASIMIWAYSSLSLSPMHPIIMSRKGGHWGFLTIQGLGFATVTVGLGLVCDLLPGLKSLNTMKRYFQMISIALACTISSIYWSLLFFAPGLILPRLPHAATNPMSIVPGEPSSESRLIRIPLHLDLALHAAPGLSMALDFFLFEKRYTRDQAWRQAPLMVLLFVFWYGGLTEYLGVLNDGIMPYPFLTLSPLPIRAAIYSGAGLLAYLSFQFLNTLHPGRPLMAQIGLMQDEAQPIHHKTEKKSD